MSLSGCDCVIIKDGRQGPLRSRGLGRRNVLATHFPPSNYILLTALTAPPLFLVRRDCLPSFSFYCVKAAIPVETVFLNVVIKFHRQIVKMPWGRGGGNTTVHFKNL